MTPLRPLLFALVLAGCGDKSDDSGVTTGSPTGSSGSCSTELVGQALPRPLYSVWGTSATDVWAVGGDDGNGPLVVHYDGTSWTRVSTGTSGDLWWVWGDGPDSVWFSGRDGQVVHHIPSAGSFDTVTATDPLQTLYGVWGSGSSDIWTVGGAADNSGIGAVSRFDGADWTVQTGLPDNGVVFKVWGASATDVWFVGPGARIFHTDGADTWTTVPNPFPSAPDLFTVDGCGDEIVAVGGFGNAAVARSTDGGATFVDDSPPPLDVAPRFTGVSVDCDHGTIAAGNSGALWRRTTAWAPICDIPITVLDFHGSWTDPDGGVWAVGGHLTNNSDGMVAYDGPATVPTIAL